MNPIAPETDPTLLSLQADIRAAADRDDAVGVAAACLAHARESLQIAKNYPAEILQQRKDIEEVVGVAGNYSDPSKGTALSRIADVLVEKHKFAEMEEIFAGTGSELEYVKDKAFTLAVNEQSAAIQINEARRTASKINTIPLKVEALRSIAETLLAMGQLMEAAQTFSEAWNVGLQIEEVLDRFHAISPIVVRGQLRNAEQRFYRAVQSIQDDFQRASSLESLINGQLDAGQTENAKITAEQIDLEEQRDDALSSISRRQRYRGDVEGAITSARAIQSVRWRTYALDDCEAERGKQYVKMGHVEEGSRIFAEILNTVRHVEDEDRKFHTLLALTEAQVEAGLLHDAVETALFVDNQFAQTKLLLSISEAQAKKRQFTDAKQTAHMVSSLDKKVHALSSIAVEEVRAGQLADARNTFVSAIEIARKMDYCLMQVWSLWGIAYQQADCGQIEGALSTLNITWDATPLIEGLWERSQLMFQVAQVYAKLGRFAEAIRLGRSIPKGRYIHLLHLARVIATSEVTESGSQGDDKRDCFKQLIVPCAYYRSSAYGICGILAELYPEQAGAIGRIVAESPL